LVQRASSSMAETSFLECPEPRGQYAVGQCDCLWRSPRGHKIVVRIFYPVDKEDAADCERAAWLPDTYGTEGFTYAQVCNFSYVALDWASVFDCAGVNSGWAVPVGSRAPPPARGPGRRLPALRVILLNRAIAPV